MVANQIGFRNPNSIQTFSHRLSKIMRIFANRKWPHGDISAKGRRTEFSMTDSERVTPSLYSCFIDIFCLSSTAQELFDPFILAGISLLSTKNVGFSGENDPQKVKIQKNTCLEGTFLRQTASFELSCVEIGSRVWAVRVAKKEKNKKIIIKGTRPVYFTTPWGRHRCRAACDLHWLV